MPRSTSCWSRGWRAIARHLDLDRNVVRRFARAGTWQQAAPTWPQRVGILTPYQGYLHRRWSEGEHNVAALFRELAACGFGGSEPTVRLCVTTHREALDLGLPPPAPARSAFEVSARPARCALPRHSTPERFRRPLGDQRPRKSCM
ncbi:MAG: hypothetical protein LBV78_05380, partial [Kitasatospora sp.]|nr:hypothetical protein [Kitasatospora sp.]